MSGFGSWASALRDPAAFAHEQERLSRVWTLLGLTTDIPKENDWFRASLGGRSVFVQRFGDSIRAYENRCAHRHYPLRTEDRGNGVVRCGFHHWQYDKEGRAVGIPRCVQLFGVGPRELGARLEEVRVATCGVLIFGRFGDEGPTLEEYLGDGFAVLRAIADLDKAPRQVKRGVKANWQLPYQISLDDYHLVAVHPSSFGKNGYLTTGVTYFRFGDHSAYFPGAERDAFAAMVAQCREGTYVPHRFRIFHFFPNLSAVLLKVPGFYLVMLIQYRAVAFDRSEVSVWYYPAPFQAKRESWARRMWADGVTRWMPFYFLRVLAEDNAVNAAQQKAAGQIGEAPLLGQHEERIGWFIETYKRYVYGTNRT